jgi:hypothetical protein
MCLSVRERASGKARASELLHAYSQAKKITRLPKNIIIMTITTVPKKLRKNNKNITRAKILHAYSHAYPQQKNKI